MFAQAVEALLGGVAWFTPSVACQGQPARSRDLAFEPAPDGGLPTLKVTPTGNTNAGPGKVRALGPADAATYRFDANAERYTP